MNKKQHWIKRRLGYGEGKMKTGAQDFDERRQRVSVGGC
jgi:hypothetical protein